MLWRGLKPLLRLNSRSLASARCGKSAISQYFPKASISSSIPRSNSETKPQDPVLQAILDTQSTPPPTLHGPPPTNSFPTPTSTKGSKDMRPGPTLFFNHRNLLQEQEDSEAFQGTISISGLVQSVRRQKKAAFVHVSDGSTLEPIQVVLDPEHATNITNGSYVTLRGRWRKSLGAGQSHELQVDKVYEIGPSDPQEYPIQKKFQTQEYLRTIPHLRIRTPLHSLVARSRGILIAAIHRYMGRQQALHVHPPLITSSDCEGAGEVFGISPRAQISSTTDAVNPQRDYFRDPKYLTVSSQLHLEAYAAELADVYALSPTFRAEESDTPRHLSEFYMLEAEHRGCHTLERLMKRVQALIEYSVLAFRSTPSAQELLHYYADAKHRGDQQNIEPEQRWNALLPTADHSDWRWPRFSHHEAVERLQKADGDGTSFKTKPLFEKGLQLEHERWIVENIGGGRPVFVTHYPKAAKPFYMLPSVNQLSQHHVETVACFDLLLPFGTCEVAGGSLREHRLENLISSMRERGMLKKRDPSKPTKDSEYPFLQPDEDLGHLRWYADLRRFGTSPHGGYGLGFDRLLAYLTGVSNLRDVVAFPRTWGRADC